MDGNRRCILLVIQVTPQGGKPFFQKQLQPVFRAGQRQDPLPLNHQLPADPEPDIAATNNDILWQC